MNNEAAAYARRSASKKEKGAIYRTLLHDRHVQRMEQKAAKYEETFHELYGREVKVTYDRGWFLCLMVGDWARMREEQLEEQTSWMLAKLHVANQEVLPDES